MQYILKYVNARGFAIAVILIIVAGFLGYSLSFLRQNSPMRTTTLIYTTTITQIEVVVQRGSTTSTNITVEKTMQAEMTT